MTRFRSRSVLGAAALLCISVPVVRADEAPVAPSLAAQPTISLTATSAKGDVAAFLKAPVSFTVKGASFLGALDAVLAASGKTCAIECRQMRPMKLTFGAKNQRVDGVLDTLAKAGGGSLYILPDKLLLSPAALLTEKEKANAKPFSVLLSKAVLPGGKAGGVDMLAIANKKISCSIEHEDWGQAAGDLIGSLPFGTGSVSLTGRVSAERFITHLVSKDLSLSFEDVPLGEALGMVAHMNGCELYLLPNKFVICPTEGTNSLTPEEQKAAVPAFQYPGFGSPNPSAPKS